MGVVGGGRLAPNANEPVDDLSKGSHPNLHPQPPFQPNPLFHPNSQLQLLPSAVFLLFTDNAIVKKKHLYALLLLITCLVNWSQLLSSP